MQDLFQAYTEPGQKPAAPSPQPVPRRNITSPADKMATNREASAPLTRFQHSVAATTIATTATNNTFHSVQASSLPPPCLILAIQNQIHQSHVLSKLLPHRQPPPLPLPSRYRPAPLPLPYLFQLEKSNTAVRCRKKLMWCGKGGWQSAKKLLSISHPWLTISLLSPHRISSSVLSPTRIQIRMRLRGMLLPPTAVTSFASPGLPSTYTVHQPKP